MVVVVVVVVVVFNTPKPKYRFPNERTTRQLVPFGDDASGSTSRGKILMFEFRLQTQR